MGENAIGIENIVFHHDLLLKIDFYVYKLFEKLKYLPARIEMAGQNFSLFIRSKPKSPIQN